MIYIKWLPSCKASKASRIWKLWVKISRRLIRSSNRNFFIVDLVDPVDPVGTKIILFHNCCDHIISVSTYRMIWLLKLSHIFYPTELIKESTRHFWIFHITSRFFLWIQGDLFIFVKTKVKKGLPDFKNVDGLFCQPCKKLCNFPHKQLSHQNWEVIVVIYSF